MRIGREKGCVTWNKGLTKEDPRVMKYTLAKMGIKRPDVAGKNHWKWIEDRSKLKKKELRNDSAYKVWRQQVWLRDNFKCKIANPDCKGRIEAHHILAWKDSIELRYEINNGITLCHFHHPKKRKEEEILSPFFKTLINN